MTDFETIDYFMDPSLTDDPYSYYEYLRSKGPVVHLPHHNVVAVTGYDEVFEVFRETATYSSCNCISGPFPGLPVEPEGDDVNGLIEQHRHELPMSEYVITQDPPNHAAHRGLVMGLLTPKRMRENEDFMWSFSDQSIDEFIGNGALEVVDDFARPFTALVIADLLGVPEEDRREVRDHLVLTPAARVGGAGAGHDPLAFLAERFTSYVEDRRRAPQKDVLTQLASVTYPDGTTPEVDVVVRMAAFLFGAGQDTTARLISTALRVIATDPELQQFLRDKRENIPSFIEEVLRLEGPVKCDFRMARVSTTLGGVDIKAGTTVALFLSAANRDPRRFDHPREFDPSRPNSYDHVAFGRGIHSCPGGPLARIEAKVSITQFLDRMSDIRISEAEHGPASARRFEYSPTYTGRGLQALHLEFTPAETTLNAALR